MEGTPKGGLLRQVMRIDRQQIQRFKAIGNDFVCFLKEDVLEIVFVNFCDLDPGRLVP